MRRTDARRAPVFSVLAVCTGNICRSPLAEQLLRARLSEAGTKGVEVGSVGLRAVVGAPMEPVPMELSARYGGDPTGAIGRAFTREAALAADLVLTMTVGQRDELLLRAPRVASRTFTVIEFVRLLDAVGDTRPAGAVVPSTGRPQPDRSVDRRALVRAASTRRSSIRLEPVDDVIDPMGRSRSVHEAVAEQLAAATARIAAGLR